MPGKRHSEEQIVYALRQVEGARRSAKFVGRWGYSSKRFTAGWGDTLGWGGRSCGYFGKREENRKLKGIVADLTLDKHILQEVLSKKA